ncbi:IS200/IS605 family transposase [Tengunoibacter tsumagoiensis]|uniref:IS200/IS605 family transposase n=1 Tax=Tengunoibacter tsumagoiensis TaxID=2014871 RepID=UPI000F83C7B1|nr:IS200/IS605 family transposase [Tengunoibacter tsumagoiensis]
MDYDTQNHGKFLILYHLIFVCKYRKKLLTLYGDEAKGIFESIATHSDFSFETMEVDQDHIHSLVKSGPRISPLAIVRRLKQESTVQLWLRHERELSRHFWKERTFWSDGYFCCAIGNASEEAIRHYIESQG